MKSIYLAALVLGIAVVLSACGNLPSEPVVNAVGAGVTESFGAPAEAAAAPKTDASGEGTESLAIPPAAGVTVKPKGTHR